MDTDLAQIMERVRRLPTWDHDSTGANDGYSTRGVMVESGLPLSAKEPGYWVKVDDLKAALIYEAGGDT